VIGHVPMASVLATCPAGTSTRRLGDRGKRPSIPQDALQNGQPMDWVRTAAWAWVVIAVPVALLTGFYLRRSDQREELRDARTRIGDEQTGPEPRRAASRPRPGQAGRRAAYRLPGAIVRSRKTSAGCIYGGAAGGSADALRGNPGPEGPSPSPGSQEQQPPRQGDAPTTSAQGRTPASSRRRPPYHRFP
jgi:hypothetical protein